MRQDTIERRAAIHEAGHAVAAARCGLRVTRVHVDGQGGGECDHRPEGATFDDLAVIAFAGPAAEVLAFGLGPDPDRWKSDHDLATELGQIVGWQPADYQTCVARAAQLVKDARTDIAWVARCLLRGRTLEGSDLERTLGGVAAPVRKSRIAAKRQPAARRRGPVLFLRSSR